MKIVSSRWSVVSKGVFWFTLSALLFALCLPVEAQQPKEARIAVIGAPEEPRFSEVVAGLKNGLGSLATRRRHLSFRK